MKFPQCGFSAKAVWILNVPGGKESLTVDVLQDAETYQKIKECAKQSEFEKCIYRRCRQVHRDTVRSFQLPDLAHS